LDDGTGRDPLEVYNFGKSANYLFRPCQAEDGSPDEECDVTFMSGYMAEVESAVIDKDKLALDEIKNRGYGTSVPAEVPVEMATKD
jgi:hypothetical protein